VINNGCPSADSISITVLPAPLIALDNVPATVCVDTEINLYGWLILEASLTYQFYRDVAGTETVDTPQAFIFSEEGVITLYVQAIHENGCLSSMEKITITVTDSMQTGSVYRKPNE
jgi:hypothetical protein